MKILRAKNNAAGAQTGFTLIELMITVAIVAILSAIAYPSYRNYVIRSQLTDATTALSALRANMERYFQDNRTYTAANGYSPPCLTVTTSGSFTISCPAPTAATATTPSAYTAKAVGSLNTAGFTYFVDSTGAQSTTVAAPPAPAGWASCATAWVTKVGGC